MGKPDAGCTASLPDEYIVRLELTEGTEPSKYLQEEKVKTIFLVAASEREIAQTGLHVKARWRCAAGVVGLNRAVQRNRPGSYKIAL